MTFVTIYNKTHPANIPLRAALCSSFLCRLRGLMLRRTIAANEGLLMVQPTVSRIDSAIHMLFMRFDIAVVWIDVQRRVVDTRLARKWRPAYVPATGAKYVLETHPDRLSDFSIGDQLAFE